MDYGRDFKSQSSYKFKLWLGVGGSSQVGLYTRCVPGLPAHDVVVKLIKPGNESHLRELLNDGRKLSLLKHPNIIVTFGYEKIDNSRIGLVLEYLPGKTLKEVIELMPRPKRQMFASHLTQTVLSALTAAHEQNISHGDISSRNILVSEQGEIKLMDFGLSLHSKENPACLKGSVDFMAPERWRGVPPSKSSDIFSVGLLAYTILNGKSPFSGNSIHQYKLQLDIFLKQKAWEKFTSWRSFFEACLCEVPSQRASAEELKKLIPQSPTGYRPFIKMPVPEVAEPRSEYSVKNLTATLALNFKASRKKNLAAGLAVLFLAYPSSLNSGFSSASSELAYLTLTSRPWGLVIIDGKNYGFTPLLKIPLKAGYHHLMWKDRRGLTKFRSITMQPGKSYFYKISNEH